MKRIVLTGGGTAGHVTPNLALMPKLLASGWDVHYIGTRSGMERDLVDGQPGITYHAVDSGKLRRYRDWRNLTDPFKVTAGVVESAGIIAKLRPNVLFSKGGFVSVPVVIGARMLNIPVLMHESDMTPGLANKICKPMCRKLFTTFPETAAIIGAKGECVGSPLRAELFAGNRARGLKRFNLSSDKPVIMVMGGSSGAQAINDVLRKSLHSLDQFQILHVCGKGNLDASLNGAKGYYQIEYLNDELPDAFAAADVIISRAGSNSLCEILALCIPPLLVPYPKTASRGDQIENAASFEKRGFARVLLQENMNQTTLPHAVIDLYHDRCAIYNRMREEKRTNAVTRIIEVINSYAPK